MQEEARRLLAGKSNVEQNQGQEGEVKRANATAGVYMLGPVCSSVSDVWVPGAGRRHQGAHQKEPGDH